MKKNIFKAVIAGLFAVGIITVNSLNNIQLKKDVADIISINVANAGIIGVNGCKSDLLDNCTSGDTNVANCDESAWYERDDCTIEIH